MTDLHIPLNTLPAGHAVTCARCGERIYNAGNTRKWCVECQDIVWRERKNARRRKSGSPVLPEQD